MQEIVPPKLNRETGFFSIILNRRNFLLFIGIGLSLLVWTTPVLKTADQKVLGEMVVGFLLLPFLFDVYGRPLHMFLLDAIKYYFRKKQQRIVIGKDISEGLSLFRIISIREFIGLNLLISQ